MEWSTVTLIATILLTAAITVWLGILLKIVSARRGDGMSRSEAKKLEEKVDQLDNKVDSLANEQSGMKSTLDSYCDRIDECKNDIRSLRTLIIKALARRPKSG